MSDKETRKVKIENVRWLTAIAMVLYGKTARVYAGKAGETGCLRLTESFNDWHCSHQIPISVVDNQDVRALLKLLKEDEGTSIAIRERGLSGDFS